MSRHKVVGNHRGPDRPWNNSPPTDLVLSFPGSLCRTWLDIGEQLPQVSHKALTVLGFEGSMLVHTMLSAATL